MADTKEYAGVDLVIKQAKEIFPEQLESAIAGIDGMPWSSVENVCGHVTLNDGRVAQITFKIETDQDDWISE